jgi:hypothetical protein
MVCFRSWISLLIFCLDDLSIDDSGVLVSHNHCVEVNICFKVLQGMFDEIGCVDIGCIQVDNWSISPFIWMECPSSSRLINVSLKLEDSKMAARGRKQKASLL